jgi:hypothetical protein
MKILLQLDRLIHLTGSVAPVPEPSSLVTLLFGSVFCLMVFPKIRE